MAVRTINYYGQPANLVLEGNDSGFDENTGAVIPAQPDVTITGVATPLVDYKAKEIDGEHIIKGDAYVLFESEIEPEIGMMITINSVKLRVKGVKRLTSVDDIKVYRKLQLRK